MYWDPYYGWLQHAYATSSSSSSSKHKKVKLHHSNDRNAKTKTLRSSDTVTTTPAIQLQTGHTKKTSSPKTKGNSVKGQSITSFHPQTQTQNEPAPQQTVRTTKTTAPRTRTKSQAVDLTGEPNTTVHTGLNKPRPPFAKAAPDYRPSTRSTAPTNVVQLDHNGIPIRISGSDQTTNKKLGGKGPITGKPGQIFVNKPSRNIPPTTTNPGQAINQPIPLHTGSTLKGSPIQLHTGFTKKNSGIVQHQSTDKPIGTLAGQQIGTTYGGHDITKGGPMGQHISTTGIPPRPKHSTSAIISAQQDKTGLQGKDLPPHLTAADPTNPFGPVRDVNAPLHIDTGMPPIRQRGTISAPGQKPAGLAATHGNTGNTVPIRQTSQTDPFSILQDHASAHPGNAAKQSEAQYEVNRNKQTAQQNAQKMLNTPGWIESHTSQQVSAIKKIAGIVDDNESSTNQTKAEGIPIQKTTGQHTGVGVAPAETTSHPMTTAQTDPFSNPVPNTTHGNTGNTLKITPTPTKENIFGQIGQDLATAGNRIVHGQNVFTGQPVFGFSGGGAGSIASSIAPPVLAATNTNHRGGVSHTPIVLTNGDTRGGAVVNSWQQHAAVLGQNTQNSGQVQTSGNFTASRITPVPDPHLRAFLPNYAKGLKAPRQSNNKPIGTGHLLSPSGGIGIGGIHTNITNDQSTPPPSGGVQRGGTVITNPTATQGLPANKAKAFNDAINKLQNAINDPNVINSKEKNALVYKLIASYRQNPSLMKTIITKSPNPSLVNDSEYMQMQDLAKRVTGDTSILPRFTNVQKYFDKYGRFSGLPETMMGGPGGEQGSIFHQRPRDESGNPLPWKSQVGSFQDQVGKLEPDYDNPNRIVSYDMPRTGDTKFHFIDPTRPQDYVILQDQTGSLAPAKTTAQKNEEKPTGIGRSPATIAPPGHQGPQPVGGPANEDPISKIGSAIGGFFNGVRNFFGGTQTDEAPVIEAGAAFSGDAFSNAQNAIDNMFNTFENQFPSVSSTLQQVQANVDNQLAMAQSRMGKFKAFR